MLYAARWFLKCADVSAFCFALERIPHIRTKSVRKRNHKMNVLPVCLGSSYCARCQIKGLEDWAKEPAKTASEFKAARRAIIEKYFPSNVIAIRLARALICSSEDIALLAHNSLENNKVHAQLNDILCAAVYFNRLQKGELMRGSSAVTDEALRRLELTYFGPHIVLPDDAFLVIENDVRAQLSRCCSIEDGAYLVEEFKTMTSQTVDESYQSSLTKGNGLLDELVSPFFG